MGFTSSLVLWLIWCLFKNMRPLNILSGIVGRITLLFFIKSVFFMQIPACAIRPTERVKKCRNTAAIYSKKHLHYPDSCSSQVCAWTMGSSSGLRSTLNSPGTSLKKTRTWYQHHTRNFTACCICISWNFHLLRTQEQGYRKVMCRLRTKGWAVHTSLCLNQHAPRLFKTESALPVVAKLHFRIQNPSYSSAPDAHTQMLYKHRKNRSISKQAVPITHSWNNHNF